MTDLTEGQRLYVVGDVHGERAILDEMLDRIARDLARRTHPWPRLIFLGDYVDRGPDSRGVIDRLIELRNSDLPTEFLLGNHDSYIEAYLSAPDWHDRSFHWLHPSMGGAETLASYGVKGASEARPEATRNAFEAALPAEHRTFLANCALWRRIGGYAFVHAGIRPGAPLEMQERDDCIWIREPFLSSAEDFGFKVVHGHTIVRDVEHRPNRIAIDTGVARGGPLTCLLLEGDEVAVLTPNGVQALPLGAGLGAQGLALRLARGLRGR